MKKSKKRKNHQTKKKRSVSSNNQKTGKFGDIFNDSEIMSLFDRMSEQVSQKMMSHDPHYRFKPNKDFLPGNMAHHVKIILIEDVVTVQFIEEFSNSLLHDTYEFLEEYSDDTDSMEDLISEIFDGIKILRVGCSKTSFIKEASHETGFSSEFILSAFEKFFDTLTSKAESDIKRFLENYESTIPSDFMLIQKYSTQRPTLTENL